MRSINVKILCGAVVATALAAVLPTLPARAAAAQLVVDLATSTGALRYGATGFLYGLGDEGIPNETMLAALNPRLTAQKAPDGRQHPNGDGINIDYLDVAATTGTITAYQAEASGNTLSGAARVQSNTAASGGQYVGWIGAGAANTLRFNNVTAPTRGRYRMVVTYANAEVAGDHQYNNNIVDRYADISVNGGSAQKVFFRNTFGWSNFRTTVIDVNLSAGANTITFGNPSSGYAPDIDLIHIAAAIG